MTIATMRREDRRNLQMAINEKGGTRLIVDGAFGPKSFAALKQAQNRLGLSPTGEFDSATAAILQPFMDGKYLNDGSFIKAADSLKCKIAAVRALVEVEAAGDGFLPDGRCDILFERHIFYRQLAKFKGNALAMSTMAKNSNICNTETGGYKGDEAEYGRLAQAELISKEIARQSASWGMAQIMGFNHLQAGYESATAFSEAMMISEHVQLDAFVTFVKNDKRLLAAIRAHDWTEFARVYNGSSYWKHKYDTRMATAYDRFQKIFPG